MTMKKYCLTLNLKNNPQLIKAYVAHHKQVWPEVLAGIKASGIEHMEIYHIETRLFMIIEATEQFSFEQKSALDLEDQKIVEWETLMGQYQERLLFAEPGEKWVLMNKIFEL